MANLSSVTMITMVTFPCYYDKTPWPKTTQRKRGFLRLAVPEERIHQTLDTGGAPTLLPQKTQALNRYLSA